MAAAFWQKWRLSPRIWRILYVLEAFGTPGRRPFRLDRVLELLAGAPGPAGAQERIEVGAGRRVPSILRREKPRPREATGAFRTSRNEVRSVVAADIDGAQAVAERCPNHAGAVAIAEAGVDEADAEVQGGVRMVMMLVVPAKKAEAEVGASAMIPSEAAATRARVTLRSMVVLPSGDARCTMSVPLRGVGLKSHPSSVSRPAKKSAVRVACITFANNFLNTRSGVREDHGGQRCIAMLARWLIVHRVAKCWLIAARLLFVIPGHAEAEP